MITFQYPALNGQPCGPGFRVAGSSSLAVNPGDFFHGYILDQATFTLTVCEAYHFATTSNFFFQMGVDNRFSSPIPIEQFPPMGNGRPGSLNVDLLSSGGGLRDTGAIGVTYDTLTGAWWWQWWLRQNLTGPASGSELDAILAAVRKSYSN